MRRALRSVLAQEFRDFEVIISDDQSPDDTEDVARSFSDSRLRYHRNLANLGVPQNWTIGLSLARGEYVCFLMDDDQYAPAFLHRRMAMLSGTNATVAFSAYVRRSEETGNREIIRPQGLRHGQITAEQHLDAVLSGFAFIGASLYRADKMRAVWSEAEKHRYVVDYALNLHLALRSDTVAYYLSDPDFVMAEHAQQISNSRSTDVYTQATELLHDLLNRPIKYSERKRIKRHLSDWHLSWGLKARNAEKHLLARKCMCDAFLTRPFNFNAWRLYLRDIWRR